MDNANRSREEMLQEWKGQKAVRPAGGLANITNQPAIQARPAGKPTVSFREEPDVIEKENPMAVSPWEPPQAAPTPASLRKPACDEPQRQHMEQQFDMLQGRLHSLKRDSRRPSISGIPNRPLATLEPTQPQPTSSGTPAPAARPAHDEPPAFGGLAAKLESLKRDSIRPGPQPAFEVAGHYDTQALSKLAQQMFADRAFVELCERGMTAQLTRSKDGATEETKIKELAGMVKVLRRGMKETQQRAQIFIEQSLRFEREAGQQVEGVRLASESATMAMQAELANARRDAAAAAAAHKTALANWQGEIDLHRGEAATLRRELERVEGERERAREEVRRAEAARAALEAEVKEGRKALGQRDRDLQVDRNEAAQALYEARETAEKQRMQLSEALAAAESRAAEAEAAAANLGAQLEAAHGTVRQLEAQLAEAVGARDVLAAAKETLTAEGQALREELAAHLQEHTLVAATGEAALTELGEWQEKASALLTELERERTAAQEAQRAAEAAVAQHEAAAAQWADAKAAADAAAAAGAAREKELTDEKSQLKGALSEALKQCAEAEVAAESGAEQLAATQAQADALAAERSQLAAEAEALRLAAAEAQVRAEEAQAACLQTSRDAADKASRLAQLEGELEALQECTMGLQGGDQRELLQRMVSKIAGLEAAVAAAEARRREAHNQLVELKGNVRVFCRIRPHPRAVAAPGGDGASVRLLADGREHAFAFDRVFRPTVSQAEVFDEVSDVVQSALDGYKVCLFSYGQTGAGKTHTMQGGRSPEAEGIIPRAVAKILATVERLRAQGWEYDLEASYVEVYNEQLRDLLAEGGPGRRPDGGRITEANAIQHQAGGGHTLVLGATRVAVSSEDEAAALVRRAASARVVESTAMNAVSSRSHSVFMLYITGRHEATGTLLRGSLNLVDLAGSERLARSQAEGQRAKEACSINKSLSALGDVFQALAAKQPHVPYRNSKLTHLLQPCLGGSGKTLMFVNINPEPESAGESLCSLRFAAKVNACETGARGGAQRSVYAVTDGFGAGGGLEGRPSLTGRASVAPTGRMSAAGPPSGRPSMAPGDRRMSMIPSGGGGGAKRKATGPPMPPPNSRLTRPKF